MYYFLAAVYIYKSTYYFLTEGLGEEFDETIDLNKEFRSPDGPAVGCHEFALMKEDIDKERLCTLQAKPSPEQLEKERAKL